jgi:hypothetical protein
MCPWARAPWCAVLVLAAGACEVPDKQPAALDAGPRDAGIDAAADTQAPNTTLAILDGRHRGAVISCSLCEIRRLRNMRSPVRNAAHRRIVRSSTRVSSGRGVCSPRA